MVSQIFYGWIPHYVMCRVLLYYIYLLSSHLRTFASLYQIRIDKITNKKHFVRKLQSVCYLRYLLKVSFFPTITRINVWRFLLPSSIFKTFANTRMYVYTCNITFHILF